MPPVAVTWGPNRGAMAGGTPISVMGSGLEVISRAEIVASSPGSGSFTVERLVVTSTMITGIVPAYTGPTNPANPTVMGSFLYLRWPTGSLLVGPFTWDAAFNPAPTDEPEGRQAWLDLNGRILALDDPDNGYTMTQLDLGYPEVREVTNNRPDRDGIDDRTRLHGSRTVTMDIEAWGEGLNVDEIADLFAPYLVASARPVLHYTTLSRHAPERTISLRPSNFASPMPPWVKRSAQLSFVAADPMAYSSVLNTARAWAGTSNPGGRTYNLTFDRAYVGGGQGKTFVNLWNFGAVPAYPLLRIWGPITAPFVMFIVYESTGGNSTVRYFRFTQSTVVDAGHWIDLDMDARTAFFDGDPARSAMPNVMWTQSQFLWIPVYPGYVQASLDGSSKSDITQVEITWREAYLT